MRRSLSVTAIKKTRYLMLAGNLAAALLVLALLASGRLAQGTEAATDLQMLAIDARLPQVIEVISATIGLDPRFSEVVIQRPDRLSEHVSGHADEALQSLARRFGLVLYIHEGIVWVDDIDERQTTVVDISEPLAVQLRQDLIQQGGVDGSALRITGGRLEITGRRETVASTSRLAAALMQQYLSEQTDTEHAEQITEHAEPEAGVDLGVDVGAALQGSPEAVPVVTPPKVPPENSMEMSIDASTDTVPELPVAPAPEAPAETAPETAPETVTEAAAETAPETSPATPAATPSRAPRTIRSISDVPGFDTDYGDW